MVFCGKYYILQEENPRKVSFFFSLEWGMETIGVTRAACSWAIRRGSLAAVCSD